MATTDPDGDVQCADRLSPAIGSILKKGDSVICARAICGTSMRDAIGTPAHYWRPSEKEWRSADCRNR